MPGHSHRTWDYKVLCDRLLAVDPNIVEIDLFGSSAYAPDLAADVDLLVTTKRKKQIDYYWDATSEWPSQVDVLVRGVRESVSPDIARSVAGCGKVLYGSGRILKEVREKMSVPTFAEARKVLIAAETYLEDAHKATDPGLKHQHYRTTFNTLFEAARHAAMTFLNTEETRWGELRRGLPQDLSERFRQIINTCHIRYWYEGRYPKDTADEAYAQWKQTVQQFINDLEKQAGSGKPGDAESASVDTKTEKGGAC